MTITVLFFAQAREAAGRARETLDLPEDSHVSDAIAALERAHPALASLRGHLAVAVGRQLAAPGTALTPGAELALLPPVSGG